MSQKITKFCDLCGEEITDKKEIYPISMIDTKECFPAWNDHRAIKVSLREEGSGPPSELDRCGKCELVLVKEYMERLSK